ncbi:MAG TPA: hypothetical protein VEZ55_10230 [Chitinophagaceae bacterium]|nr:hypothetical protein [Chitinophagaceae bacterium]
MKQVLKRRIKKLAILVLLSLLLIPAFLLVSFRTVDFFNVWEELGIKEKDATWSIQESFLEGYLAHAGAKNYKNIIAGKRLAVAVDLLGFTKEYVHSNNFKRAYEELRKRNKPPEPRVVPTTEEIRESKVAVITEELENIDRRRKKAIPDGSWSDRRKMLQQQLQELNKSRSELLKQLVAEEEERFKEQSIAYKAELKKWERSFPSNHFHFVKRRLHQMLEATRNVDYSAELTERNGVRFFVNPEYEQKDRHWKCAFRAGRQVTETTRIFVQQWLKELN